MLNKPSKQYRAQSAMEYLMTYGWAILIIAVVLGALFSLGVFNGSSVLGNACVAQSGYLCQSPLYGHGVVGTTPTAGNIVVQLGQNTGQNWNTANIVFVPQGTTSNAGVPNVQWAGVANGGTANVVSQGIVSGQTLPVTLPVTGIGSTVSVGQAATGAVWAEFTSGSSTTPQYVQIASINIKAS